MVELGMLTVLPGVHGLKAVEQRAIISQSGRAEEQEGHQQVEPSQTWLLPPMDWVLREGLIACGLGDLGHVGGGLLLCFGVGVHCCLGECMASPSRVFGNPMECYILLRVLESMP